AGGPRHGQPVAAVTPTGASTAYRGRRCAPALRRSGDRDGVAAVGGDLDCERLGLDPVGVLEQVGVRCREREPDAVRQLEPCLLAHRVDTVDQLVDAALPYELVVEGGVERDG